MVKNNHYALTDLIITLLIFIIAYFIYFFIPINQGTSWHIEAAHRMLAGGTYVTNLFDDSTPATFALFIPLVWLHQWLGGNWPPLITAYVLVLYALPLYPYYKVLSKHYSAQYHWRAIYCVTIITFLLFSILFIGQRETIAAIFLLPYLLLTASYPTTAPTGKVLQIVAGCLAALAAAQLPVLVPIILITDIFFNIQRARNRLTTNKTLSSTNPSKMDLILPKQVRTAQISFYLIFLLLMGGSYLLYPEFFSIVIPLVVCFESGFDPSDYFIIGGMIPIIVIIALQCAYLLLQEKKQRANFNLLIINVLLLILYFIQGKNWVYHLVITYVLIFIIFGLDYYEKEENETGTIETINFMLLMIMIGVILWEMQGQYRQFILSLKNWYRKEDVVHQLLKFTNTIPNDKKIMTFTVQLAPTYPFVHYSKIKVVTPWGNAWLIPKWANSTAPEKSICHFNLGKNLFFQQVYATFKNKKPDYFMVDIRKTMPYVNQKNFDYIKFLNQDPRVKKLLTQYQYLTDTGEFAVFVRKDQKNQP